MCHPPLLRRRGVAARHDIDDGHQYSREAAPWQTLHKREPQGSWASVGPAKPNYTESPPIIQGGCDRGLC